jgi:outer membrane protein
MNRTLVTAIALTALLFGIASTTISQERRMFRIGVVVDGPWERNEEMRTQLQAGILELLGRDAPVQVPAEMFLVGNWTLPRVRELDDSLLADPSVDLVLGMGLITSQDLATRGPLPKPVIAPIVIDPQRQHIPIRNGASGVRNLSYLVYPTTFVRDLQLYREIVPIHKLVNISSRPYDNVLPPPVRPLPDVGKSLGLEITEIHLGFSAQEALDSIPADADAVFLEPTLFLPSAEFAKLVDGFIKRRLPSFAAFGEEEVRKGIMASANPDILPMLVRRIAIDVQRIRDGEEPGTLSVGFTPGKKLTINMRTAYAVGVSPKWSVLLEAELAQVDTSAPGALAMDFPEAVRRFADLNLDVQAKINEVAAEANNIVLARSGLLPRLDVGATGLQLDKEHARAGGQPDRSGTFTGSASQVIFAEPVLANLSVQSSLQRSREQDLEITRLNSIVNGATAYVNYLRARKIFFILLDNLKLARTNLEIAHVRQSTGVAGPEEPLRWQVEIANLRKVTMDVQSQINQALYALKQSLNLQLLEQVNVSEISLNDSTMFLSRKELLRALEDPLSFDLISDFLVSEGARRSPELEQLDALIAAQERSLVSTHLSYFLPTVSAFGNYSHRFASTGITSPFQLPSLGAPPPPQNAVESYLYNLLSSFSIAVPGNVSWNAGIQLSLNLFNGFATRATEERGAFLLEQLRVQRAAAAQKIALRIRVEMEKTKASYFAMQQSKLQQQAARQMLDIVSESYSNGAISILSLLDAQNAVLQADQIAANALSDFFLDYVSLERAVGAVDILMTPEERGDLLQRLHEFMTRAKKG